MNDGARHRQTQIRRQEVLMAPLPHDQYITSWPQLLSTMKRPQPDGERPA